jgi:AsmA protein
MSKLFRILLTVIGVCILLILVAIFGLVVFVNPNDLKPQIIHAVNKYTGRQLQLGGNIEWSIFPWLGLQLNNAELSNTPGFGNKPFAQIQRLDIQVRLLPLLHKQLEIAKFQVNNPTLYLVRNPKGQTNWQVTPTSPPTPLPPPEGTVSSHLKPLSFVIAGVDIQNGHLFFDDQKKKKYYELTQLQLHSSNLSVNKSSPFLLQFNFYSKNPEQHAQIKLNTDITLSADEKTITFNKVDFNALWKNSTYPKGELPISVQGDATLNLNTQSFTANNLILIINQNKLVGHIEGQNLLNNLSLSGALKANQVQLNQLTLEEIQLPFQFHNNILSLDPILGKLYQGSLQGDARIDLSTATPRILTHQQFSHINMQALFQALKSNSLIQVAGLANIGFKLTTQGNDQNTLIQHLQGQGQFMLDNGMLKGINLSYWVAVGKALLHHQVAPVSSGPDTPFNQFMGSFTINNGIVTNNDLFISSGRLHINGKGSIDLPKQHIDYEVYAQAVLADGSPDGIAIPLSISGQFNNIRIAPSLDKLSVDITKEKIKGKIEDQLKKLDLRKLFH